MDMEHQEIITNHETTDSNNNNGGGLLIKLKMAKAEPFSEQGNRKPETLAPRFTKICHICQKGFESGKALGGHMRMHVQESKGLIKSSSKSPKPNGATELFSASATDSGGEHVCIECGKIFPSKKSLYGHMRSHPDRPYRGIEPPTQFSKNSSTSTLSDALPQKPNLAEDQQIDSAGTARVWFGPNPKAVRDLVKVVPSWSKTAKRGRKDTSSLDSETDSESDDDDDCADDEDEELDMSEAVHDLMMLAQANPKGAEEATNSNFMTKNNQDHDVKDIRVIDYLGVAKKRKKLEIEEDGDLEKPRNQLELGLDLKYDSEEELSDSENSESIVLANMMKRKKRRKMKLEDLDGAVVVDHQHQSHHHKVYTCSLCNKSFQSHQALGGHMSSHNKLKNNNNNNNIQYSAEHDHHHQSGSEDTNNANANLTNTATQIDYDQAESHQCRICNRTFLTGQALGGHMRSHWNGPNDQAQSGQTGRKGLDIDLNELPPMEYEQGIDYSGAGYATSSYNSVNLS